MARAMRFLHFLILIMILSVKYLSLAQNNDSNEFYYGRGFKEGDLQLDGYANFRPNGLLQLTNTSKQATGHAFYPRPFQFKSSSSASNSSSNSSLKYLSFSTNFVLAIVPELFINLSGHGMAFVISPSMNFSGAVPAHYLGLFKPSNNGLSSNHIFAVEFDTTLSADLDDINNNHVGIDLNGLNSNESAPVSYYFKGENLTFTLISGRWLQVWIDYDGEENLLTVTVAPTDIHTKPTRPLITKRINLSSILLDYMYVGFSAATGSFASNHYVLGWSFNKSGQSQNLKFSDLPSVPQNKGTRHKLGTLGKISIGAVVLSGIIVAVAIYFVQRKRYEEVREDWEKEYGPQRFSYKDLYRATKGFKDKELLGSGGFGKVYRGVIPSSNEHIAVKKISHGSKQGLKEFVAEIATMGRLRHRNLVNLLGYCRRRGELLLVYDYMPNGSLDMFLFSNDRKPNLAWFQRFRIIKDVASALLYLHEEWEQVVLHRDVKASNVMLDSEMNGRLGDFGLARLHDHGSNSETTLVVGTIGYLAPELARTGKATTSSDVFGFGAFMLEMVCGRKPIEFQRSQEELVLVDWVFEHFKRGKILETVDIRVENDCSVQETELVLKLGLLCSNFRAENRPNMKQITLYLNGDANLPEIGHEYGIKGHGIRLAESTQVITDDAGLSYGGSTASFDLYPITRPLSTNVPEIEIADEYRAIGTAVTADDAGISYSVSTASFDLYPITQPLSTNVPEIEIADEYGVIGTEVIADDAGISYSGPTVNKDSNLPITSSHLYPVGQ